MLQGKPAPLWRNPQLLPWKYWLCLWGLYPRPLRWRRRPASTSGISSCGPVTIRPGFRDHEPQHGLNWPFGSGALGQSGSCCDADQSSAQTPAVHHTLKLTLERDIERLLSQSHLIVSPQFMVRVSALWALPITSSETKCGDEGEYASMKCRSRASNLADGPTLTWQRSIIEPETTSMPAKITAAPDITCGSGDAAQAAGSGIDNNMHRSIFFNSLHLSVFFFIYYAHLH